MLHVVMNHEYYQFKDKLAEQDFLSWCACGRRSTPA